MADPAGMPPDGGIDFWKIAQFAWLVVAAAGGWLWRTVNARMVKLEEDVAALRKADAEAQIETIKKVQNARDEIQLVGKDLSKEIGGIRAEMPDPADMNRRMDQLMQLLTRMEEHNRQDKKDIDARMDQMGARVVQTVTTMMQGIADRSVLPNARR